MDKAVDALYRLKERWNIDDKIIDLMLGKIKAKDTIVEVNGVTFHIPTIDDKYILWQCLWPECHNCCENQARLPLTIDDIEVLAERMKIKKHEFIEKETRLAEWEEDEPFGSVSTLLTMFALKRKDDESNEDDGKPLRCRFLDERGYCILHPSRPGCCKLYPFASWTMINNNNVITHATFQFDGNCPGFYISDSLDDMREILEEYAKIIRDYNSSVNRTIREGYGSISIINY